MLDLMYICISESGQSTVEIILLFFKLLQPDTELTFTEEVYCHLQKKVHEIYRIVLLFVVLSLLE